jgi:hypothetical protein
MVAIGSNFTISLKQMYQSLGNSTGETAQERSTDLQEAHNEFFVDEGIGWQMIDGELLMRGTETFESPFTAQAKPSRRLAAPPHVTKYTKPYWTCHDDQRPT